MERGFFYSLLALSNLDRISSAFVGVSELCRYKRLITGVAGNLSAGYKMLQQ